MMLVRLIFPLLAMGLSVSGALACSIEFPSGNNPPTKTERDCSFKDAAGGGILSWAGAEAVDLGRSRVGQTYRHSLDQSFLVADCASMEVVSIAPPIVSGSYDSCGFKVNMSVLLPPKANYANREQFSDIVADARARGLDVDLSVTTKIASFRKLDRFDPFCGCKQFYPDSAGAK